MTVTHLLFRTLLSVIPHLMRNPEVYSKKKLEFSIETFRHGNHLVILRERSCQQLKYLFFFIFIILVKNWSEFPIKDFGNDISVVIQSDCGNPGLKESGSPINLGMTITFNS